MCVELPSNAVEELTRTAVHNKSNGHNHGDMSLLASAINNLATAVNHSLSSNGKAMTKSRACAEIEDEKQHPSIASAFQSAHVNCRTEQERKQALDNLKFCYPPTNLNESDPMLRDYDINMPELAIKDDAQLSSDEPSSDYTRFILNRNQCEASESQKLAKLLSKTSPSSGWGSPQHASGWGSPQRAGGVEPAARESGPLSLV